jgi:hypothetical protein
VNAAFDLLDLVHVEWLVAGPLITAPVDMSNREPWHWHMIVVPVSRASGEWAGLLGAGAEVVERWSLDMIRELPGARR